MIKSISASGPFIEISGGGPINTYISPNYNAQGVGNMRFNTTTQNMEVFDGTSWQMLAGAFPTVGLNSSAISAINWAMAQMQQEADLQRLADKHPAVKIAFENMQRAQEQLKATIILSKDEQTTT